MDESYFEGLKQMVVEAIPWVKDSGMTAEVVEERHVVLKLPKDRHLNHVGIVYAGSLFMVMEIAGAVLMAVTYPPGENYGYVPINKGMSIDFIKPGMTDMYCDLTITEEEAVEKIKPIDENGRGDWFLDMEIKNEEGEVCATSRCNYYVKKFTS